MTASLFVSGTRATALGRDVWRDAGPPAPLVHAVAKPVVDGLESSVCGQLVTATAAEDWPSVPDAPRCEECARIAG